MEFGGHDSFDLVTGFNAFQFTDDKERALSEGAQRVSTGAVAVVVPSRASESGLTAVFQHLFPLFPSEALEAMRQSGIFALSAPGKLEEALAGAGLTIYEDTEIQTPVLFDSIDTSLRAFMGAGPTQMAVEHSGEQVVRDAAHDALKPFLSAGSVKLPPWYRVVFARPAA